MKKTVLILSVLLTTIMGVKAQSVNWHKIHSQNSNIILSDVVVTADSGVVIAMVNDESNINASTIIKYDYWGNKKWEKQYNYFVICDLSVENNQIIGSAYSSLLPDFIGNYDSLKIFKLDMQGNQLLSKMFIQDFTYDGRMALHYPKANGTLNLYTNNKLWNLNANFDSISTKSLSNFEMLTNIEINKGKTFVYGYDRVSIANANWTVNKTLNINDFVNSFYLANDTIYAVKNQNIIRIDTNLNVIDSIDFSSIYGEIFKIERQNNTLFIFGYTNNDQILIKQCNLQFVLIKDILIENPLIVNPAGEYLNNCFAVGKNTLYLSAEVNNYCLLASISQESPIINIENIDISIETASLTIDSTIYYTNPGGTHASGVYFSTDIVIKNNSSSPISNFKLFSKNSQNDPYFGNTQVLVNQVINKTIAPNDTIILHYKKIFASIYDYSSTFEFCVEASLPNNLLDPVFTNNAFCQTVTGVGFSDKIAIQKITVFPNPCQNELNIKTATNIEEVSIYNCVGQKVLEFKTNISAQTSKINISTIEDGLYIVKIKDENKNISTQKIIIKK